MPSSIYRQQPGELTGDELVQTEASQVAPTIAGEFFEKGGGVTYYGTLKVWTGSVWDKLPSADYLVNRFVAKSVKRWDGSHWLLMDTTGV
jgi:hypothetical protein